MTTPGGYNDNPYESNDNNQGQQPSGGQYLGGEYGPGQYPGQAFGGAQPYPGANQYSNFAAQNVRNTGKGFFGALFDISFDNFIALKFAKFIYILAIVLSVALVIAFWVFPMFAALAGGSFGFFFLILLLGWIPVGLIALFQLIGIRLFLEFVVATMKTSENTSKLVDNTRR